MREVAYLLVPSVVYIDGHALNERVSPARNDLLGAVMAALRRQLSIGLIVFLVFLVGAGSVLAQSDGPRTGPRGLASDDAAPQEVVSEMVATAAIPERTSPYSLVVQATSWPGTEYTYFLTLLNLSPWPIPALSVLDRYFPMDPTQSGVDHPWHPGRIDSSRATAVAFSFPEGPLEAGCHQLEINIADGLGVILMDCSPPGMTTVWDVVLTEEMAAYLAEPLLTAELPAGGSKIGLHVTRNSSPAIMDFVRSAQPAVVAAVGDVGWLTEVKEDSPDTVTIGRFAELDQTFEGDPIERARAFVGAHVERYLSNPGVDYWLGWNEPIIDELWQMDWYASFEAERAVAMAELGLKVAVGNFSAGTPEADEFALFVPAIAVVKEFGGILAVHEYSAPTMREGVGAGIPGFENREDHGALTLRYRYWYEHFLRPNDLVIPLVVTEAGVDGGVLVDRERDLNGWRDFGSQPLAGDVIGRSLGRTEAYLEQISWYDDELRRDSFVLGFAIFNVGDRDGQWSSFDITGILPELGSVVTSKDDAPTTALGAPGH